MLQVFGTNSHNLITIRAEVCESALSQTDPFPQLYFLEKQSDKKNLTVSKKVKSLWMFFLRGSKQLIDVNITIHSYVQVFPLEPLPVSFFL